ncbi:MAG: hypothetical protein JXA60_02820 [Candidatus Coatesbacteria bacterium]|nr:hypothetical protein [Candidatus Coatesbacteria bacterium]
MECPYCKKEIADEVSDICPFCNNPLNSGKGEAAKEDTSTSSEPYIVQIGGREFQAANLDVLKNWASEMRISPNDLVKEPGSSEWKKASDVIDLFQETSDDTDEIAIKQRNISVPISIGLGVLIVLTVLWLAFSGKKDVKPPEEMAAQVEELRKNIDDAIIQFKQEMEQPPSENRFEKTLVAFENIFKVGENLAEKYKGDHLPSQFKRSSVAMDYIRYYCRYKQRKELTEVLATFYKTAVENYKNVEPLDITKSPSKEKIEKKIATLDKLKTVFRLINRFRDFEIYIDDPEIRLSASGEILRKVLDDLAKFYGQGLGNKEEELRIREIIAKDIDPTNVQNNKKIEYLKKQIKQDEMGPGLKVVVNFYGIDVTLTGIEEFKSKEGRVLGIAINVTNKTKNPFFITPENTRLVTMQDEKLNPKKEPVILKAIQYTEGKITKDNKEEVFLADKYQEVKQESSTSQTYILYYNNVPNDFAIDNLRNRFELRIPKKVENWANDLKEKKQNKEWSAVYYRLTR